MDKIKGLATTATRYGADAPFEPWVPGESDGDGVVSPGESLRTVANCLGGLPRPLYLGVREPPGDGSIPTSGFDLLSPQHLDDDGAVALDGDVPDGATCAWHTLCARASTAELEAAADASRVALRLAKNDADGDDGGKILPLRSGLDETLSVLGAIVFTCCGRGADFHGAPNKDSNALRAGQPNLPIVGCFCNGEIGPPPFSEKGGGTSSLSDPHIAGFTCSSVICRLDGADEILDEALLPPPPPKAGFAFNFGAPSADSEAGA